MRVLDTSVRGSWSVERVAGRAGDLHARGLPDPAVRTVAILEVERPAVVLGIAQSDAVVDRDGADRLGVDVVRRRGGGGAVWLDVGEQLWIDVVVGRGDPLWDDDVGRAFLWLGEAWSAALGSVGLSADVHHGPLLTSDWSDRICFAGLGPGEVTVDGRKVVGISQRRVRDGARFQSVCYGPAGSGRLLDVLALDADDRAQAAPTLDVVCLDDLAAVEAAFLAVLPT